MACIVYGVSVEDSCHSSRGRAVLEHLSQVGHEFKVVTYSRVLGHLGADFDYDLLLITIDN